MTLWKKVLYCRSQLDDFYVDRLWDLLKILEGCHRNYVSELVSLTVCGSDQFSCCVLQRKRSMLWGPWRMLPSWATAKGEPKWDGLISRDPGLGQTSSTCPDCSGHVIELKLDMMTKFYTPFFFKCTKQGSFWKIGCLIACRDHNIFEKWFVTEKQWILWGWGRLGWRDPPGGCFVSQEMKDALVGHTWTSLRDGTASSHHCDATALQMQRPKIQQTELKNSLSHPCVIYFASWDKHQVNEWMCLDQKHSEQGFTHLIAFQPPKNTLSYYYNYRLFRWQKCIRFVDI